MTVPALTWEMIVALSLTLTILILFIGEWLSIEGISVLILAALGISGILPGERFLVGFSTSAPWMVAALFVVGAGFLHTGIVNSLGFQILQWSGYNSRRFLLIFMVIVTVVSAFLNNTTVVAVFMPFAIMLGRRLNLAPSRLLMPLSFCSIFGGTCTLIGTSTNVVVSGFSNVLNFKPIGMFEMSGMGIIYALAGLAYMFVMSTYFIPDRRSPSDNNADASKQKKYITEFQVTQGSPFIGKAADNTPLNDSHGDYKIFNIVRGEDVLNPPFKDHIFMVNDLILLEVPTDHINLLQQKYMLSLKADHHLRPRDKGAEPVQLAEVMIAPGSRLIGNTLERLRFRLTHHVVVLAIQRSAKVIDQGFSSMRLESGDILLISGSAQAIERLRDTRDATLLSNRLEERQIRPKKAWIALTILIAFVISASFTNTSITVLSLLAAAAMVGFGCLSLGQAYESINWDIVLFLGSSITLGYALEETGAANFLVYNVIGFLKPFGERGVILGIYALTTLVTCFITNNAAAALMIPFAYDIGAQMGVDSRAIIMTVLFAASASFATPMGYQTNIFIYGPGGYKFRDFLVIGAPLTILLGGIAVALIPYFWPSH